MNEALLALTLVAAGMVGIEGMNKLERTDVRSAHCHADRMLALLRALGWALLVLACVCILFTPLVPSWPAITIRESGVVVGFAVLVLRERVREWCTHKAIADPFDRTVRISPETLAQIRSALPASAVLPDPHRDRIQQVLNDMEQKR